MTDDFLPILIKNNYTYGRENRDFTIFIILVDTIVQNTKKVYNEYVIFR